MLETIGEAMDRLLAELGVEDGPDEVDHGGNADE